MYVRVLLLLAGKSPLWDHTTAMSCVHFKFKNRQEYEKVSITGLEVSCKDLKEAILKKKKIGHSDLEVVDAQSKKG